MQSRSGQDRYLDPPIFSEAMTTSESTATPVRTGRFARPLAILAAIAIAGVLAVAALMNSLPSLSLPAFIVGEEYQEVGVVVVEELRQLAELTTVEMVETTTISRGDDHGILNFALGDSMHLFAVARIGAGVNLEGLGVDSFTVDEETGVLHIEIPRAEIFYSYLDSNGTSVLDRNTGLLTKGDAQLESETRAEAERILQAQAIESGILERAHANAEEFLTGFFTSLGYTDVVVTTRIQP